MKTLLNFITALFTITLFIGFFYLRITKETYNKITVKSLVPQNNNSTQKQIIDIASQKLIKIFKNMTETEIARKAKPKVYLKSKEFAKNNITKKTKSQYKKYKNIKFLFFCFLMQFFSLLLSINLSTNSVNASKYGITNQAISIFNSPVKKIQYKKYFKRNLYRQVGKVYDKVYVSSVTHNALCLPTKFITREMGHNASWLHKVRCLPPYKASENIPTNVKFYDKTLGFEILNERDMSKHQHSIMVDARFQHPDYEMVVGSFTSTNKPIDGIIPRKISDIRFHGKEKPQYFLEFTKPKLVLKTSVKAYQYDVFSVNGKGKKSVSFDDFKKGLEPPNIDMY